MLGGVKQCPYTEWCYAECHYEWDYAVCPYAEWCYAECNYAVCHYAKHVMLSAIMSAVTMNAILTSVMLIVVIVSIMAPLTILTDTIRGKFIHLAYHRY